MKLSDRVEALAGPCREVDAEIAVASGFYVYEKRGRDRQEWFYPTNREPCFKKSIYYGRSGLTLERYTADLNVAMTLVPEGWALRIKQTTRYDQTCWTGDGVLPAWLASLTPDNNRVDDFMSYVRGQAATPALALCAAALRARGL